MAKKEAAETTEPANTVKSVKLEINEAKKALNSYLKENKLKASDDHSADKKHGKTIAKLEKAVEKSQEKLKEVKAASKGTGTRQTKYDYPADIDTPEKRKKYRQEQRAAKNGDKKPKKEKAAKAEKAEKSEKTSKKSKKSKSEDAAPKAGKKKGKKSKKSNKDD